MATKVIAGKTAKEVERRKLSSHDILSMEPAEVDAYIDAMNPAEFRAFMRDFVKMVLLKTVQ